MKKKLARQIQLILFLSIHFLYGALGRTDDFSIIGVKKNITLADDEPVFHDLIINAGANSGIKKNQVFTAFRRVAIKDDSGVQNYGEIDIPVGEIKILSVFSRVAIARQVKLYPREENPVLDIFGLMSGDHIEEKK